MGLGRQDPLVDQRRLRRFLDRLLGVEADCVLVGLLADRQFAPARSRSMMLFRRSIVGRFTRYETPLSAKRCAALPKLYNNQQRRKPRKIRGNLRF